MTIHEYTALVRRILTEWTSRWICLWHCVVIWLTVDSMLTGLLCRSALERFRILVGLTPCAPRTRQDSTSQHSAIRPTVATGTSTARRCPTLVARRANPWPYRTCTSWDTCITTTWRPTIGTRCRTMSLDYSHVLQRSRGQLQLFQRPPASLQTILSILFWCSINNKSAWFANCIINA